MRKRREVMSEGKKKIISELVEEYDIHSAEDIQDALKDLLGGTIQSMLEAEMDEHLGYESYERMASDITNKLLPEIELWQQRPLSSVYPIVFIDAVYFSVRDNNVIRKLAAYIILGINEEGRKEVLSIQVGENESSKYLLSVLNELKNRGVKDILILCADGLTGIKEYIAVAFPNTEYQRCILGIH